MPPGCMVFTSLPSRVYILPCAMADVVGAVMAVVAPICMPYCGAEAYAVGISSQHLPSGMRNSTPSMA